MRLLPMILLIAACGESAITSPDPDPEPEVRTVQLSLESGGGQKAPQGLRVDAPVVIQARFETGELAPGVSVSANVTGGGGRVEQATAQTDAEGRASFEWTLGTGYSQSLRVQAEGSNAVLVSAVATYRYFQPPDDQDGWEVAAMDAPRPELLFAEVDGIRSGRWSGIHSLLIAHQGKLVFEEYWPGGNSSGQQINWDRFTAHEVQSASKSYRSALIGMAIDRGLIGGVDEPLSGFFPDYQFNAGKEAITLEHVLTMSTGLEWNESGAAAGNTSNHLSQMYRTPPSNWTGFVLNQPLQFTPGGTWVYNTGASIMLNDILARGTGMQVANFVREFMADPTESDVLPGVGNPLGAVTRPRDMLRLGQVFLSDGMWKETRVLSEDWVEESLTERFQFSGDVSYGYQWWMRTLRTRTPRTYRVQYASGNGGQYIILVDDLDLVIVSTGGNFGSSLMNQIWPILEQGVLAAFER
ncbi:MAG: beta-lactamase family protein [Rhodothermales bacterium]|nr:beta-lactamase family protein [Rhodothermales bacterium]MBO6778551.1 beta-lactamase family protein [Rhodothermales bacterium]